MRDGFQSPPDSAKPQTWWHWMNGNITKAGITADLEAMKRIGLGGATIVNVDCEIPAGPVKFMSPEWRDCFKFAVQEADRLGLKLCVENCAGWSSSGGPWVTPANAMQKLTFSETKVRGGSRFDDTLRQPPTTLEFYRDIAVLAYQPKPIPKPAAAESNAKVELKQASYQSAVGTRRIDVTAKVRELIDKKTKAVEVRNATFGSDPAPGEVKEVHLELAVDGRDETLTVEEGGTLFLPANAQQLSIARKLERVGASLTFVSPPSPERVAESEPISQDQILDLTNKMNKDGRLQWDVPAGDWRILRIGYTPTGKKNHPSPIEGLGLEVDKMSKAALDAHWDGFMQKVLDDIGPLAGRTLDSSLIDSYEVGKQDWTANFRDEFQKRRGYDPTKFLLTFARVAVDSTDVTERFLWDMRRTVADLFAENYFGHFAELCRQRGLSNATEPYGGGGPFDSLQAGISANTVMGEFWVGSTVHPSVKLAASIAHVNGKTVVAAESFTAAAGRGRWLSDPYSLKVLGDLAFCQGLNRYVFHRFAMQPWTDRVPGMTMGKWGFHFDRTITWWDQGKAWIDYVSRCQFLLQQGRSVNDVAYFAGESAPSFMRANQPPTPAGFDYDAVNAQAILNASVRQGRITLPSGASYAVLVLPPGDPNMTPPMLEKIGQLVRGGATVIGQKPQCSPSLVNFPACDEQITKLAGELWGNSDGKTIFENQVGQGRVVWGKSIADVFAAQALSPDFTYQGASADTRLAYSHRVTADEDIYFVSNQRQQPDTAECTFRVSGKTPELWHADSGEIEPAAVWSEADGRTTVSLSFDPADSVFVIFRRPDTRADNVVAANDQAGGNDAAGTTGQSQNWQPLVTADGKPAARFWGNGQIELKRASGKFLRAAASDLPAPAEIPGPWTLSFPPGRGAPAGVSLDRLISWPDHADAGVRYFSGTAAYQKQIDIPADRLTGGRELWLDLGDVQNIAEVSVNGQDLGVLWKPPFRVNVTKAAKEGTNHLVVKITNLWPNRLIGDEQLPPDTEWKGDGIKEWPQWLLDGKPSPTGRLTFTTWHHWKPDSKLLPSGLLGPVMLRSAAVVEATER